MRAKSTSNKIVSSLLWKYLERGGVQITQFVVSLVIARILTPEEYGPVSLLTVFISLATVFVQSGLSTALIQKKDTDEIDYSSVFYYSLALACIFYIVLFFGAWPISVFYKMPELVNLLRVMALTLFPGALNALQIAILSKSMNFQKQFYSSLIAVVFSGGIGIALAKYGYGAWALVFQHLSYQIIICIVLWITLKWRPKLLFSFVKTKVLLSYGIKLLGAKLIDTLYHNLETLIIGKKYSSDTLAFCNKGKQFPLTLIDNIDGSVQSVMLPAYAKKQDCIEDLKQMLRKTLSLSTYLIFPAMMGLAMVGKPLVYLVLGAKWLNAVPFLQLYCVISMLFPLQTANLQAINAIGKSGIYFNLMAIKRVFGVVILFIAVFFFRSVYAIVIACLITEIVGILVNVPVNKKLLHYSFTEQIRDILPNMFMSLFMCIGVYFISLLPITTFVSLLIQCLAGALLYISISLVLHNKNYYYMRNKLRAVFHK